ncbi:hypothetical protein CDL12_20730 [Handroanthus impetiginosus]|uniref:Remorin C-terminal domain-containing protein n=1 Tax=Handroanthus impetiginosus TaxID=429701 RepID=A0A2G9GN96_9LAMI|nr:hypothetical protein CDL12_20730 [Handroanthus impetiginosus]
MDLSSNKFLEPSSLFSAQGRATLEESVKNPFLDSFSDPFCKLNLKETSEFVKSFPVSNNGILGISAQKSGDNNGIKRNIEAPSTPGRPIFSFSNGSFSRKSFPSKWDDAEKWLVSGSSCNDSPGNNHGLFRSLDNSKMFSKHCSGYKPHMGEIFAEKSRITEEKVSKVISNGVSLSATAEVLLKVRDDYCKKWLLSILLAYCPKCMTFSLILNTYHMCLTRADKYPNEVNPISPKFGFSEPMQEKFVFRNAVQKSTSDANSDMIHEVKHRDIGTEMTPLGSSTTSRCPTPFKSTSPARHNTPANLSGPLSSTSIDSSNTIEITQLQECHLAKLQHGTQFDSITSNWSSREEEEEDVSKSLRHFEMNSECRRSVSESRSCANWEEEEKTKSCLRYQREEAKIQAWVNLQSAKAEAESRKLEVKIQKMRSNLEEKLMKRMADVHRKAEEWRATAQFQHSEQVRKVGLQAKKVMNKNNTHFSGHKSCGCFPCNNYHM